MGKNYLADGKEGLNKPMQNAKTGKTCRKSHRREG
jgi:hypothetical protein